MGTDGLRHIRLREVSDWIGPERWSSGIVTEAWRQFLTLATMRPLQAQAAKDNIGLRRFLEKNGFTAT